MHKRYSLVIIVGSPLTENIYERIGANELSLSFDVQVFDCIEWTRKMSYEIDYRKHYAENIISIQTPDGFEKEMSNRRPDFLLDYVGYCGATSFIQKVCKSQETLYITHLTVRSPNPIAENNVFRAVLKNPMLLTKKVFQRARRAILSPEVIPPDVALIAGSANLSGWISTARKIVYTASPAWYELQRNTEPEIPALEQNDFVLFIDECLVHSFDYAIGEYKPMIEAASYRNLLLTFFDWVEDELGLPIVVAAHPNGKEIDNYVDMFGDRTVLFDSTAVLSKHCTFAMTHFSTAINYPVILRKPILLLGFKELMVQFQGRILEELGRTLKRPVINIDSPTMYSTNILTNELNVDEAAYRDFELLYISNLEAPTKSLYYTLCEFLQNDALRISC